MPQATNEISEERAEFDGLFLDLTGIDPECAKVGADGFLFIPPEAEIGLKPQEPRRRICELAGSNGWRNHLENDDYAGWWIKRPA